MAFNQNVFQEKIRSLMNGQTLLDFASGCGVSRSNLTRLLSDDNDTPPRKGTLKKIADYTGADFEELLDICGYTLTPAGARRLKTLPERARLNSNDMETGFKELTNGICIYDSIEDFLDLYTMLYSVETCKFTIYKKIECCRNNHKKAEYSRIVRAAFNDVDGICYTFFVVCFAETKGGKIVVTDVCMDGKTLIEEGFDSEKFKIKIDEKEEFSSMKHVYFISVSPKQKLLKAIFGEGELKKYPYTIEGFGFYVDSPPVNFRSFLREHINTLEENTEIRIFLNHENINAEEFFSNYKVEERKNGFGHLIAKIMSIETGLPYKYMRSEQDLSDEPPVIMVEDYSKIGDTEDEHEKNFSRVLELTEKYAAELGITKYGERHVFKYGYESSQMQFDISEKLYFNNKEES